MQKESEKLKGTEIKGYDFSKPFDLNKFLDSAPFLSFRTF